MAASNLRFFFVIQSKYCDVTEDHPATEYKEKQRVKEK